MVVTNPALGAGIQLGGAVLAKRLHSPRLVRALVGRTRMPMGNRAGAVAAAAELATTARSVGLNLTPAAAQAAGSHHHREILPTPVHPGAHRTHREAAHATRAARSQCGGQERIAPIAIAPRADDGGSSFYRCSSTPERR